jgi:hypothetical protein
VAKAAAFPLVVRIPGWCQHAAITINGRPQNDIQRASFYRMQRRWQNGDEVVINFPMPIQTQAGPSRSVAINRGPVVYSLKIGEQWTVRTPDPLGLGFDEFEVHATTPWNYALQLDPMNSAASFKFTQGTMPKDPFDPAQPSVSMTAPARLLPEWTVGWRGTHAFEPPCSPVASSNSLETVTLVPFGSQHLRISWFPFLGEPAPFAGFFTENFDDDWSSRWTVFGGNWTARENILSTVPASANGVKALAMATAFTNFTYEGDVSVGPAGNAGLIFRVSKPDIGPDMYCGYYAGISVDRSRLEFGCAANSWNSITNVPMTFSANTVYHLTVEARGPRLKIFVGATRQPVVDVTDARFASGMIGVRDYCSDGDRSLSSFSHLLANENDVP